MLYRHILLLGLSIGLFVSTVAQAANIQGPRRSALQKLQDGDAVRKRLLLREGRFEVSPSFGFTLNDAYRRNALFGVKLDYHIKDNWAVGTSLLMGVSFDSALAEQLNAKRQSRVNEGSFSDVGLLGSLDLTYTPLFGKVAFMGRKVLNYDFQISVGGGVANLSGSTEIEGLVPVAVAGAGLRVFTDKWMAVNIQVRDYLYSSALNAVADANTDEQATRAETEVRNNFTFTLGYSFLFPRVPKVSE
jgi:outer membrane beta-barrel protein